MFKTKKRFLALTLILAMFITSIYSLVVYADDSYTVTINYDPEIFNVQQAMVTHEVQGQEPYTEPELGRVNINKVNFGNCTLQLVDSTNGSRIENMVIDDVNHKIIYTITDKDEFENLKTTKIRLENYHQENTYRLFDVDNQEVEFTDSLSGDINSNVTYTLGTYVSTIFQFQNNPTRWNENDEEVPDPERTESIDENHEVITYKHWSNKKQKYVDVKVSLVQGTVDPENENNIINEKTVALSAETYTQDKTDEHGDAILDEYGNHVQEEVPMENRFGFYLNQPNFNGYYLKVVSDINDEISLNVGLNTNFNTYANVNDSKYKSGENTVYISLDQIAGKDYNDIQVFRTSNRYEAHRISFTGFESFENNKLTYTLDNKNLYIELIKEYDWVWNEEEHRNEQLDDVVQTLQYDEQNNKYYFDFSSENNFNEYYFRLSYDGQQGTETSLEGLASLIINGRKRDLSRDWEDYLTRRHELWDYSGYEINVNGIYSLIGDVPVTFEPASYNGKEVNPKKSRIEIDEHEQETEVEDESMSVVYEFDNYQNYDINITKKTENEDDRWPSINFLLSKGLKIYSDDIREGNYRVEFNNRSDNVYLMVNGRDVTPEMEIVKYRSQRWNWENDCPAIDEETGEEIWDDEELNVYYLKESDITETGISLSIGFNYKINLEGNVEVDKEDNTKATWEVEGQEVTATFTGSEINVINHHSEEGEEEEWSWNETYIKFGKLTNSIMKLEGFDSETMDVIARVDDFRDVFDEETQETNTEWFTRNVEIPVDEEGNVLFASDGLDLPYSFRLDIRRKELKPDMEEGYFTIAAEFEDRANADIKYYFNDAEGNFLNAQGEIVQENMYLAGTIKKSDFVNGKAKIALPENAEYIRINADMENNTISERTDFYVDGQIDDSINLHDVIKGLNNSGYKIDKKISENPMMGMYIEFWYWEDQGGFEIPAQGVYLDVNFNDDENATLKYSTDIEQEEVSLNENNIIQLAPITKSITMKQTHSEDCDGPEVHARFYKQDEEDPEDDYFYEQDINAEEYLEYEGKREDGSNNSYWKDFMDGFIVNGEGTLDISKATEEGYTVVLEVRFRGPRDPDEDFKAHVLSWGDETVMDERDAQIVGGTAYVAEAYIYDEEHDEEIKIYDRKINGDGTTSKWTYGEPLDYSWEEGAEGRGEMYTFAVSQGESGGEVEAVAGVKLVFEFTPDYGKQLVEVGMNGTPGASNSNPKYYEFIMPAGHAHFNARFEERDNEKLVGENTSVSNVEYELDNKALDSGTAVLSIDKVDDNTLTSEQKESFANKAGNDYTVTTYLDVDLTQVWFKGTDAHFDGETGYSEDDVWTKDIFDLGNKKATITITLENGITPEDVVILHEIHDDKGNVTGYETVTITDKHQDNDGNWVVTFITSKFSNYAVASKFKVDTVVNELIGDLENNERIANVVEGLDKDIDQMNETEIEQTVNDIADAFIEAEENNELDFKLDAENDAEKLEKAKLLVEAILNVEGNYAVVTELDIPDVPVAPSNDDQEVINESEFKDDIKAFYDIGLIVKVVKAAENPGDENTETVIGTKSETDKPISVELEVQDNDIKEELNTLKKGHERKYFIYRIHEGQLTKIPATYDETTGKFTFKSDKFSLYGIGYEDTCLHNDTEILIENEIDSTCTEEGSYEEVVYCHDCEQELSRTPKVIQKKAHTPEESSSVITTKATPSKDGQITITKLSHCSVCGEELGGAGEIIPIYSPNNFILSKTTFTYNKKAQKPKITVKDRMGETIDSSYYTVSYSNKDSKKIGEYKVTIKFKGEKYEGSKTLKYKIVPKGTSISKLTALKKSFKATWKKQTTETTGYEIQYSTDKNFKKGNKSVTITKNKTTSTTVKKLTGKKKYYVRIRTYKKVGKTKYYSNWSKSKYVTTKK